MKNILLFSLGLVLFFSCKKKDPMPTDSEPKCPPNEAELILAEDISENHAYPFHGDDPSVDDPQLDPLLDYLSTARIVGLGEATHGTSEFYRMKDKLFRLLVLKKDFKAIIFEIPWGNALVVNDFVTKGIGTADASIDQTFYWTYDTEEVRSMAQWIHDYNLGLATEDKIFFVGCDPQGGDFTEEKSKVIEFLNIVEPDSVFGVLTHYAELPSGNLFEYKDAASEIHQANIQRTKAVYDYLENNRENFTAATSAFEYEVALMAAHVIQSREELYRIGDTGVPRDELMAFYTEWWQRILGQEAKVAVWAHNFHVMDGATINATWMGTELRQRQGSNYKNVAFSFGTGSFNAFLAAANREFLSGVQSQSIPEVPCRTINQVLTLVEGDQHYLIFDELGGATKSYFETPQSFVQLGAGFNYSYLSNYTQDFSLARLFDVVIHFDETSASVLK
jgi:erythromycin esterase